MLSNPEHLVAVTTKQHRRIHSGRGVILVLPIGATPPPGAVSLELSPEAPSPSVAP
jgi:hypothetical protein